MYIIFVNHKWQNLAVKCLNTAKLFRSLDIIVDHLQDELHSRLRFVRRGLVAMANAGAHDNGSQFFFTLAATPELNNKHTIFGKVGDVSVLSRSVGHRQVWKQCTTVLFASSAFHMNEVLRETRFSVVPNMNSGCRFWCIMLFFKCYNMHLRRQSANVHQQTSS